MPLDGDMGAHMKTTIEISDHVLAQAKRLAAREGITLRALVEQGLRHELARRRAQPSRFVLRDASFGGEGLQPALRHAGWEELRELAYQGRS
jgi:Arc/MetJ family transcription regulator